MNDFKLDNLIDAIGSVSDYAVLESTDGSPQVREQNFMKWATVAASFVLVCVMGFIAAYLSGGMGKFITPSNQPDGTTAPTTEQPDNIPGDIWVSAFVLECGEFDNYDIYAPQAINSDTLDPLNISEEMHFPVCRINSRDELRALTKQLWYEQNSYFETIGDDFFEENALFLAFTHPLPFTRDWEARATVENGRLLIELLYNYDGGIETPGSLCVLVTIKKSDADALTYADAKWFGDGMPESEEYPVPENIAYAGYGAQPGFYEGTLTDYDPSNPDRPAVFAIRSRAELDEFCTHAESNMLAVTYSFDNIPSFIDLTQDFDDRFFSENTLFVVYVTDRSSSIMYSVHSATVQSGNLTIYLTRSAPELVTADMAGWFLIVTMQNDDAGTVTRANVVTVNGTYADDAALTAIDFISRDTIIAADIYAAENKLIEKELLWAKLYTEAHYPEKTYTDAYSITSVAQDAKYITFQGTGQNDTEIEYTYVNIVFDDGDELPLKFCWVWSPEEMLYFLTGVEERVRIDDLDAFRGEIIDYIKEDSRFSSDIAATSDNPLCGDSISAHKIDMKPVLNAVEKLERAGGVRPCDTFYNIRPHYEDFDGVTFSFCIEPEDCVTLTFEEERSAYYIKYDLATDKFTVRTMTGAEHFDMHNHREPLSMYADHNDGVINVYDYKTGKVIASFGDLSDTGAGTDVYISLYDPGYVYGIYMDRYLIFDVSETKQPAYRVEYFCIYDLQTGEKFTSPKNSWLTGIYDDYVYYDVSEEDIFEPYSVWFRLSDGVLSEKHIVRDGIFTGGYASHPKDNSPDIVQYSHISADGRYVVSDTGIDDSGTCRFYAYDVEAGQRVEAYIKSNAAIFYRDGRIDYSGNGRWIKFVSGFLIVFDYAS